MERTVQIVIGVETHTVTSDDDYLLSHNGVFEPATVRLLQTLAPGARTALDVGANIGLTALALGSLVENVHAFEASLSTHHWLAQNVQQMQNVITHPFGVGRRTMTSEITIAPGNRSGGYVSESTKALKGFTVERIEIRRLDELVRANDIKDIDLIKIDVEGYELQVIEGAAEVLWRYRPVITMEMNHWCLNVMQRTSLPDFIDYLCSVFPQVHAVEGDNRIELHNTSDRYAVMYHHVNRGRFKDVVCAYDEHKIRPFLEAYSHGIPA